MFKQILVPIDGSPASTVALKYGITLAQKFGAALEVITLFDPYPIVGAGMEYGFGQAQYLSAAKSEAEATIQLARNMVETTALRTSARVIEAQRIWKGIVDEASATKADLIVMGSHGRSGVDKLVMGSVTQRVLQHTKLPVLVVRD
ncbi:MAG: universal stress protein [Burkholderiales bacterium]|nr:universal stress protein [Burkholderiales bacterium]